MKRRIAAFLAVCMMLQTPCSALAALKGNVHRPPAFAGQGEEKASSSNVWATKSDAVTAVQDEGMENCGTLRINVKNFLGAKNCRISVFLEPSQSTARKQDVPGSIGDVFETDWECPDGVLGRVSTFELGDIPEGSYRLTLEGADEPGAYLTYSQEVRIRSQMATTLNLANDYPEYYGYGDEGVKSKQKFGVLMAGNFTTEDQDEEALDEADLEVLLDALYGGEEDFDSLCDLNGDDVVDLRDLEIFTKFYKNKDKRKAKAIESAILTEDMITPLSADDGSEADGDGIRKLFAGTGADGDEAAVTAAPKEEKAVSADNPVTVSAQFRESITIGAFAIVPKTGSANAMEDGEVTFTDDKGNTYTAVIEGGKQKGSLRTANSGARKGAYGLKARKEVARKEASPSDARQEEEESQAVSEKAFYAADGEISPEDAQPIQGRTILIDLGGQIPVKQVTIRITKTVASTNLADISKVEFLNGLEDHIPEPDLSIPDKLAGEGGDAQISVTWRRQANVTGYHVYVTGETEKDGIQEQVFPTELNSLDVTKLNGSDLCNNKEFTVKVRSVNDDWRSEYSSPITVITEAAQIPKPPEQIQVTGGYRKLTVSWKKMKSTDSYTIYYREKDQADGTFTEISQITGTTAEITGLKDGVTYELYMTGTNKVGVSGPSNRYSGTTLILEAPVTPNFKLLNVPQEGGGPSPIITGVANSVNNTNSCSEEFAVVDGRYETAWVRKDWDAGCAYPSDGKAPIITFDQPYEMDTVVIVPDYEQAYAYTDAKVYYWEDDGTEKKTATGLLLKKQDAKGKVYYEFQAREMFRAKRVQMTVSASARRISYAELKFYEYYDLKDRIFAMYTDDLHMVLKPEVTLEQINGFYEELEYVDPVSGEKTPKYDMLKLEIDTAKSIFEQGVSNADIIRIDGKLAQRQDSHTGFAGGLNTWQPLGVTGLAGDKVILYVGGEKKTQGEKTSLAVIATQYHGESSNVFTQVGALRIGPNEITIPKIMSMSDVEAGGQLYIRYDGGYNAEEYAVRVEIPKAQEGASSAAKIPVLNVFGVTEEERESRIAAYVEQLEAYDVQAMHEKYHPLAEGGFDEKNCVFGATDIAGVREMFSLPIEGIRSGINGQSANSGRAKTQVLSDTLTAMDEFLTLSYQHKGLSDDPAAGEKNRMPVSRINIRYQRMFEGAFMYAGGAHIGIGWGSAAGMMAGRPLKVNAQGEYEEGSYFGWGIGHEIGHEINEGAYAVAEVTNNYYALLGQKIKPTYGNRWGDDAKVYAKVTSGAKGPASNGAVQLAIYWQLHLAYDKDPHFTTYEAYSDLFNSVFFARVDSYARNAASAPKPGGVGLTLNGDKDNNLMRLGCAAAQKDILEFFERWGMEPDEATKAYAGQFEKETRGIWLSGEDQWKAAKANSQPDEEKVSAITVGGSISYSESAGNGNEVTINLEASDTSELFGYEVFRCEWKGDTYTRRPICFVPAGESGATDVISTINNRAFTYEAVGYDTWLRPTERVELGTARVSHNGGLGGTEWEAGTNMVTVEPTEDIFPSEGDDGDSEEATDPDDVKKLDILKVIDGDNATTYTGKTEDGEDPEIILYLNQEEVLTGLEYRLSGEGTPIGAFEIYVSQDGATWKKAAAEETSFTLAQKDDVKTQTIIFSSPAAQGEGRQLCSYEASMVKITAPGQAGKALSVSEIMLIGQTGDKVDLLSAGIGILAEDYCNPSAPSQVLIPKGSLIFNGTYAGNPAYNTVLLWDDKGNIVGGTDGEEIVAKQLIFAEDPGEGDLRNISDGKWVYFIEPDHIPASLPAKVRAELYRVNNAIDQTGQRLVSSTVFVDVPAKEALPQISFQADGKKGEDER